MKELIMNYKIFKILFFVIIIVLILIMVFLLFLKFYLPFGKTYSKTNEKDYEKRAGNFYNGIFNNVNNFQMIYGNQDKNNYLSNKYLKPKEKLPIQKPNKIKKLSIDVLNITWFGHSTILIGMHGMNILIDPVFSNYSSPFQFLGPKRFSDLPMDINELPNIDIVVISHDHYDHLDYSTIKQIDEKVGRYIVPLGVENHLERWKINKNKIINMAWWEETEINGLKIACTPARHYSGRSLNDRYKSLWSSWVFIDEFHKVFESGDTGFDTHFEEIHNKYGDFDLALLDSGQYDKRWKSTHMVPEESVLAGKILNAKVIMPIHWGTFKLSNHPWDDPVERFVLTAKEENIKYMVPKIGQTVLYDKDISTEKWWKNIR